MKLLTMNQLSDIENFIDGLAFFKHDEPIVPGKNTQKAIHQSIDFGFNNIDQILIKIFSTWGNLNYFGLTEIQLFDLKGEKIDLFSQYFELRPSSVNPVNSLKNIFNGFYNTTNEDHMIAFTLPSLDAIPEIAINISKKVEIGAIRIWNYNHSLATSSIGIRGCKILYYGKEIYSGELMKAPGICDYEYCHEIKFFPSLLLPKLKQENTFNPKVNEISGKELLKYRPTSVPNMLPSINNQKIKPPRRKLIIPGVSIDSVSEEKGQKYIDLIKKIIMVRNQINLSIMKI